MARLTRRRLLGSAGVASVLVLRPPPARGQTELIVTVNGGTFEEGWRKAVIQPFEQANPDIKVSLVQGLTFQNVALMRAQKDAPNVDVIMMDDVAATQAAAEGLAHPLSIETVPNLNEIYPEFRVANDIYTKIYWVPEVLAYNTQVVTSAPQSWAEVWDLKYKGRVAVSNIDTVTGLMFFLLVNAMRGGTVENADPGFAAMRELKGSIVAFPTQHAQQSQLFTQGDIVIAPWVSDRTTSMMQAGQPIAWTIPKEGAVMAEGTLAIAKGTKKLDAALKYVNFAIGATAQAANAKLTNIPPVNQKAVLDTATLKAIPNGPEALKITRRPDWKSINQQRAKWIDRWNREIVV